MDLVLRGSVSKSGSYYECLGVDLGYRFVPLCFDVSVISELLGLSRRDYDSAFRLRQIDLLKRDSKFLDIVLCPLSLNSSSSSVSPHK